MKDLMYSIAPRNADDNAAEEADYVTQRSGGRRAVAEACIHIIEKFFSAEVKDTTDITKIEGTN